MQNPFVYGEVVPVEAFVDRETELERLVEDLSAGQKVFLISPRRYGKSSLVRQALRAATRRGALAVEVTVSSYSSYLSFLEGYARALAGVETRWERARNWLNTVITSTRPEVRYEPGITGSGIPPRKLPERHTVSSMERGKNPRSARIGYMQSEP